MKIATWNLERPSKTSSKLPLIIEEITRINADIIILTETNQAVDLGNAYQSYHTTEPPDDYYKAGERRVSIYSKFPFTKSFETFDAQTSICACFNTLFGELAVYGTIIGIHGNRRKTFDIDLDKQIKDFHRISAITNQCIAGDLNISFSDNYYFTKEGRDKLNNSLAQLDLINTTAGIPENIDHIILPNRFIANKNIQTSTWNNDKKLSDHIGVMVEIV
jgi:exonuclease III